MSKSKLWAGRFTKATDELVVQFTESVSFDRRLYRYDIAGSMAHARMLAKVGILEQVECDAIVQGLLSIERDIEQGEFRWSSEHEDVHMNIEAELTERVGDVGKKLHTGRSRNDQIATDLRLYLRDVIDEGVQAVVALQSSMLDLAERETDTIMPGFTHLQTAQPVTLGHHLLAWVEMLERDRQRLAEVRTRVNVMPLGAAALAGTSFAIDREFTALQLGFDAIADNSLDAVSDRDFAIEFCGAVALIMVHLSRMAEELILWMSEGFRFVAIGDAFCTGSSIMPQKKNPDVAELIRGKSARAVGNHNALMVLMKSQPLAYNRDNQEDKERLFDSADTVLASLRVFAAMLPDLSIDRERMLAAARAGYSTATDLAEYLVRKNIPFRDAHSIVGKAVRMCIDQGIELSELELPQLKKLSPAIDADVYDILTLEGSVNARCHRGGTAPDQVRAAVARARRRLAD